MPKEIQIEFKDGTIKKYRDRGWGTGKSTYKISTYGDKVIVEENYEQGFSIFKSKEKNEHNFRSSEIKKNKNIYFAAHITSQNYTDSSW